MRPGFPGQSRHMSDPDYVEPNEDGEAGVGGTTSKRRQRPRRKRAQADRSALEWQCVTIVRDDDVNPVVQCNFCPWKSGATRIRQHILRTGPAIKYTGDSSEYYAMKSQLLEKKASTPDRDPI